jgi:hypothetical protein
MKRREFITLLGGAAITWLPRRVRSNVQRCLPLISWPTTPDA